MATDDPRRVRLDEELLLRRTVDQISAMLAYWDSTQRCRLANRAYERWFGISPSRLIGMHISELLGPLYELNRPHIEAALRGEPQQFERDIPDPSGGFARHGLTSYMPDVVDGVVRGFFAFVTDISDVKRTEREQQLLAEAGTLLSATLDYEQTLANVARLVVRELADFCIVEVMEARGHLRRIEVVSADPSKRELCRRLAQLTIDRERPHLVHGVIETRQSILIAHVTPDIVEAVAQTPEHLQALRDVDAHSAILLPLLRRGELLGTLALISSKPERVYGPDELRLAEALAERAGVALENARNYRAAIEATELRDQVLGIVAHDLRNPLAAILMQSSALQLQDPEMQIPPAKSGALIHRAATRMNRLIQDLLDVARLEAGHLTFERARVQVTELLTQSVEMQKPLAAAAALDLVLVLEPGVPDVAGERDRLLQVFENLIGNALKFTEPGGHLAVGATAAGGEVLFRVSDDGHGIPAEDVPHLFDRFWQAHKADHRGAGLGLSVVKGIVEGHGGRIWVESVPGRGTTFFFTVPAAV